MGGGLTCPADADKWFEGNTANAVEICVGLAVTTAVIVIL